MSSFKPDRDIFAVPPRLLFAPTLVNYATLWTRWGDFFRGARQQPDRHRRRDGARRRRLARSRATPIRATAAARCALSAFFLIFIRLIPPIVITLPLFPVVNCARPERHAPGADHALRDVLRLARHAGDAHLHRPDPARARRGGDASTAPRRRRSSAGSILPLSAQGMVAVAVFVIVFAWNEFLFAFIFTTTRAKTAPLVISEMIGAVDGVEWGVLFAASTRAARCPCCCSSSSPRSISSPASPPARPRGRP